MTPDYKGRHAVVLGLGITGVSTLRHLARHGADLRVADTRSDPPGLAALVRELPSVPVESGPFSAATFKGADLIAISPGVAKDQPAIRDAVAATNGKTTVTSLTGALTRAAGLATVVAGNIG